MDSFILTLSVPTYFSRFSLTFIKMPITQLICSMKNFNIGEKKTDIKATLLGYSIIVNTFEIVVKFEIKKQVFSGDGIFAILMVL